METALDQLFQSTQYLCPPALLEIISALSALSMSALANISAEIEQAQFASSSLVSRS